MQMWTFVTVTFNSNGAKASEIHKVMKELGFRTTIGNYDYVYKWEEKDVPPAKVSEFVSEKLLTLIDTVQKRLEGKNVQMHFRTFKNIK